MTTINIRPSQLHTILLTAATLAVVVIPTLVLAQDDTFGSTARPGFEEGLITCSVGSLFRLIEGSFGALIMVVAGLGAIISAAMGAYRAAVGMLVVAVGSFILRSLVSLFFGNQFMECTFE